MARRTRSMTRNSAEFRSESLNKIDASKSATVNSSMSTNATNTRNSDAQDKHDDSSRTQESEPQKSKDDDASCASAGSVVSDDTATQTKRRKVHDSLEMFGQTWHVNKTAKDSTYYDCAKWVPCFLFRISEDSPSTARSCSLISTVVMIVTKMRFRFI